MSSATVVTQSEGLIAFKGGPRAHAIVLGTAGKVRKQLPSLGRCRLIYIRAMSINQAPIRVGGALVAYNYPLVDRVWLNGDATNGATATTTGLTLNAGEWFPFPLLGQDLDSWYIVTANASDGVEIMAMG